MPTEDNLTLDKKIEALLFMKAEPMEIARLAKLCDVDDGAIRNTLATLKLRMEAGATTVVVTDDTVALATRPEAYEFLLKVLKLERTEPLTKAQLETLSIITYEHPVSSAKIEYIRGVNSRYSIRSLMLRGLIERKVSNDDARVSLYSPSIDLLQLMGVNGVTSLPHYDTVKGKLARAVDDPSTV